MPPTNSQSTRDSLVRHAQEQFWSLGYSNVGLRAISTAAGVDVALISRYFGGKRGLFLATLSLVPPVPSIDHIDQLMDVVLEQFCQPLADVDQQNAKPTAFRMILMNADDPEIGSDVRAFFDREWQQPLAQLIGNTTKASMFLAALLGFSVAEKSLALEGIAPKGSDAYRLQLKRFLDATLSD